MFSKFYVFLFLWFGLIWVDSLEGKENSFDSSVIHVGSENSQKPMRHNLSVCCIFKNEAPFLKEWIEYYRLVGVDHFYLYDNGSTDRPVDVLNPYIQKGLVTLTRWPDLLDESDANHDEFWALSTQITAYQNATQFKAAHDTKWLILLDVNEFLVSTEMRKLVDLLEKYEDYAGINLQTDFFDASTLGKLPPRRLVVESVELTAPQINPPKEVTKTIFKPDLCKGFLWPPCECVFYDNLQAIPVKKSELRVNRYVNRSQDFRLWKRKTRLEVDNRLLSEEELAQLLNEGYEIEDKDSVIQSFVPWLLQKLGLY